MSIALQFTTTAIQSCKSCSKTPKEILRNHKRNISALNNANKREQQMRVASGDKRSARLRPSAWLSALRERGVGRRNALLLKDVAELQRQLEEAQTEQKELRAKYREATHLHRDQRTQLLRLRVAEQLFEASVGLSADDSAGTDALTRLLRLIMETVEAGGGVLWLRAETGNTLVPQVCEGRVAAASPPANSPHINIENILRVDTLSPVELRARCEAALQRSAPVAPRPPFSRRSAQVIPTDLLTEEAVVSTQKLPLSAGAGAAAGVPFGAVASLNVQPAVTSALTEMGKENDSAAPGVAILTLRAEEAGANGHIFGVVGVCDPRGQSRFTSEERERLQSLSRPLAAALRNVLQRVEANRRLNEQNEMSFTMAKGTANEATLPRERNVSPHLSTLEPDYQNIVARVMQAVPCENCTLFLLDAAGQRLEARATQGRVVNLLDHIGFARGHGVSGWVAAQGRPLHIADLAQEPNLLHVEMIPPRVRSFLAVPLCLDNAIVGVLNVSHARAHAFSPDHVRLLSSLADQAAQTI